MKQFLFFLLIQVFVYGENLDTNSSEEPFNDRVLIEDMSGLSDDEIREVAKERDTYKKTKKVSIFRVVDSLDEKGKIDISKLQSSWEELSPSPKKYDWIQTKSGEWFKGDIKAMYNDKLEFRSDEIGLYIFDFDDIAQIKSYHIINTNIEDTASISGLLRFRENNLTIIQGDNNFHFTREQIVSFAKSGELERNYWSGKITLNLDMRSGNKNQFDYTAKGFIDRRTSNTKLRIDYLGKVSNVEGVESANDHRINEKYDVYLTRNFFLTPLFSEAYFDKFQNVKSQYTAGMGLGYTFIKTKKIEWDISSGPAYKITNYYTVLEGEDKSVSSPSLELSTIIEYKLSKKIDIKFNAKITYTDENNGRYKHHIVLGLENEILSWLDFDVVAIWDRTQNPGTETDGTILKLDDFELLLGLGVEF